MHTVCDGGDQVGGGGGAVGPGEGSAGTQARHVAGGTGSAERHGEGLHRTAARGARGLALTEGHTGTSRGRRHRQHREARRRAPPNCCKRGAGVSPH